MIISRISGGSWRVRRAIVGVSGIPDVGAPPVVVLVQRRKKAAMSRILMIPISSAGTRKEVLWLPNNEGLGFLGGLSARFCVDIVVGM